MTRFEQELSGALGNFWKQHAEREIAELAARAEDEIRTTIGGAAFWASNGRFLPSDVCEKLAHTDFPFDPEETARARKEQANLILQNYRHETTAEEKAELRAAFGAGTTVVDCISGERFRV